MVYFICHFLKFFTGSVSVQKNANFSPKALTKERTKPSSNHCIFLVCGLNIKPKFKTFLLPLGRESWAGRWTQHSKQQFETIRLLNMIPSRFLKAPSSDWTWSKLKTDEPAKHQILAMYSTVSKNYEKSLGIVTQIYAMDLDFDCYMAGSLKRSSCVVERTRREPKPAFKPVLPVHS